MKLTGAALLPVLLVSCSGSVSTDDKNGAVVYLAEDPQVMASSTETGDTHTLEIFAVEGAVVELK